jgi:hypothetical protein
MNPVFVSMVSLALASIKDFDRDPLFLGSPPSPDQPKPPAPDPGVALRFRVERAVRKANAWRGRNHLPPLDPSELEALAMKIMTENHP